MILNDPVLPIGWEDDLQNKADLERSFLALRGIKHFYAEACRARIRLEQLRFEAAKKYFLNALRLAEQAEDGFLNSIREYFLNIWTLDYCLAGGSADEEDVEEDNEEVEDEEPEIPEEALEEFPALRAAVLSEELCEARQRLYHGESSEAAVLFEELRKKLGTGAEDEVALCHIGLAACELNLALTEKAHRSLENAQLAIAAGGSTFGRGKAATVLLAFYRFLKKDADAACWEAYIGTLPCPRTTKELFEKRARHVLERCEKKRRLVIV